MLPLHCLEDGSQQRWASADWRMRAAEPCCWTAATSAGLRLPLDSISWKSLRRRSATDPRLATAAEDLTMSVREGPMRRSESAADWSAHHRDGHAQSP